MYKRISHTKYLCQYHLIWCPKFRFKVLNTEIQDYLKIVFQDIANTYSYEILEMEIMPDHIHLFVGTKPTVAPTDIIKNFKGISAVMAFRRFPTLKQFYSRSKSLWSRGKFISTIGKVSEATIRKYIQEQKGQK